MRIVAGKWRGRTLVAPAGTATRPTSERVRQALFDTLLHAAWGGRTAVVDALVLDVFAGTGALGLEALSRGARHATFIEQAPDALVALRSNIRRCGAESCTAIARLPAPGHMARVPGPGPATLVFLDPPYGLELVGIALEQLRTAEWIAPEALLVAETAREEALPFTEPLDSRVHGAARITISRLGA